jgi:predicted permease
MSDIRYALRSLLRARWFTVAAVFTFALGIGVNVAVFSTVDRILLRPLPYGALDGLVVLRACGEDGECAGGFPSLVAFEARERLATIDDLAVAAMAGSYSVSPTPGEAPPLRLSGVSANLLRVIRVQPVLGRDFTDEDAAQRRRVAILSHESWLRRFGGSPDVITTSIGSAARPVSIIGVLPPGFIPPTVSFTDPTWDGIILDSDPDGWSVIGPGPGMVAVPVARLVPGATVEAARAEVDALVQALAPQFEARAPQSRTRQGELPIIRVDPIQAALFSRFRANAWLILAAAVVLLLLACANLANLLLARGRSREYDAAIHASLGAGPGRLVGAALLESLIVCGTGAGIALGIVAMTSKALAAVLPPLLARYAAGATDQRVLGLTLFVAVVCAIAAGVLPAWRASRVDVLSVLQSASAGRHRSRLRGGRSLIVVESALGVLLVLSGLLLFRSFTNFSGQDLGFNQENLYSVTASGAPQKPLTDAALAAYEQTLATLAEIPGVRAVGGADTTVVSGAAPMRGLSNDRSIRGGRYQVSANYFETLQTPFLAGRSFTDAEVRARAPVAILSESAARIFFADVPPARVVGRSITVDDDPARAVVGIVPDLKGQGYERDAQTSLFLPLGTQPSRFGKAVVRMEDGLAPQRALMQERLSQVLGPVTVNVIAISAGLEPALRDPRFRAVLFTVLSLAALLLAAIGLYAIASFDVAQRQYEMAVRLSLGARARDIQHLVILGACRPVVLGVLLGVAGAYWAEQFLKAFLFGVEPRDPAAYAGVVLILLATTTLAAWIPARRAVRVDPATTLRAQ